MGDDYRTLAREIEDAIRSGTLPPGHRLLPQRDFAWRRGVAVSTASRVYGELRRRGFVAGEVGRGTFVLAPEERAARRPPGDFVDLERIVPQVPEQARWLARSLAGLVTPAALERAVRVPDAAALARARGVAAAFLARDGWAPRPEDLHFAGNGRDALAAAFALVARPGDRIGVEALSYPIIRDVARKAGVTLVPLPLDAEGLVPGALRDAQRAGGLAAVYVQPTLHNPLGLTMGAARRRDLARVLEAEGLVAVEDAVNGFLADDTPLAAFAPARVVLVESLSKRLSPDLTIGVLCAPEGWQDRAAEAARAATWGFSGWMLAAAVRLMQDGTAARLAVAKRAEAAARQAMATEALESLALTRDTRAFHLWMALPKPWRAERFVDAAAARGIVVTPGSAFAMAPGHAPDAVRLGLGTPPPEVLRAALATLRALALGPTG